MIEGLSKRNHGGALIGVTEAARRLGVSSGTLRIWLKKGRIPCVRFGGHVLFKPGELEALIEENSVPVRS